MPCQPKTNHFRLSNKSVVSSESLVGADRVGLGQDGGMAGLVLASWQTARAHRGRRAGRPVTYSDALNSWFQADKEVQGVDISQHHEHMNTENSTRQMQV